MNKFGECIGLFSPIADAREGQPQRCSLPNLDTFGSEQYAGPAFWVLSPKGAALEVAFPAICSAWFLPNHERVHVDMLFPCSIFFGRTRLERCVDFLELSQRSGQSGGLLDPSHEEQVRSSLLSPR